MNKTIIELYNKITAANLNDKISTRQGKKDYEYGLTDALNQQGYKVGIDYEVIYDWRTSTTIKKLKEIKPYKEPQHNIKVDDIFYHSWGYEQTNIDFYQVIKATKKTVTIRPIKSEKTYTGDMSGVTIPLKDAFKTEETITKTPYLYSDTWYLKLNHGICGQWDETPMRFTEYA